MFSYLAASYFVGAKLSDFQVNSITGLYAVYSPFPCLSSVESLIECRKLSVEYLEKFHPYQTVGVLTEFGIEPLIGLFLANWLVSFAFMYRARKAIRVSKDHVQV
jgi:hypothetical protein